MMPSNNMKRYCIDLYPSTAETIDEIITNNYLARIRFLRECVTHILNDDKALKEVIELSKGKPINYG